MAQEPEQHTLKSNLEYRLTKGDLPKLSFGIEKPKNVEVTSGGEELLQNCLSDPAAWSQDPLLFRLAHTHAASIKSCRENRSPSIHAIFLKRPDEPLRAWVHLDGHGAQTSESRIAHLGEFLYHKITFHHNDEDSMYENLERSFSTPLQAPADPAIPFTGRDRLSLFGGKTLTHIQPYASSFTSAAFLDFFNPTSAWGEGRTDRFTNRVISSFTTRLVTYGLQSGAAAALHEDLRYKPSRSTNPWKRSGHALLSTFVLETPRGNDIAFANIFAAVGSGVILKAAHPGREDSNRPGIKALATMNLLGFAESNLWNEFKPDIKRLVRGKLHRH